MTDDRIENRSGWPLRPVLLGGLGALACLAIQQIGDATPLGAAQRALMAAIATGALAFGFTAERLRLGWAMIFATCVALVTGFVMWWNGAPDGNVWWAGGWNDASLFAAIAIAAPLFQTARDEGQARFPYHQVHAHVWTNIVLWCASWAFVGITLTLSWLLAALFELIGIDLLTRLLGKDWFEALLIGGAFGAALGLFREREAVVRTLRRVVTTVLSVLAPVLGVGLVLFLLALPFTGLGALWAATKATTPILLACAFGAWVLANTVIGDGAEDEATNPALRWGAIALGVVVLPLGVIAGIATGLRIEQYGVTPERLWAVVFDAVAILVGLAYWIALARWRLGWAEEARPANLRIAFVVAGIALFLATPILSFNALSAHDQVARLESGRVKADKFDWAALAFDFGTPGKRALQRLTHSKNAEIARAATQSIATKNRQALVFQRVMTEQAIRLQRRLRVLPRAVPLPRGLADALGVYVCDAQSEPTCILVWRPGAKEAVAITGHCGVVADTESTGKTIRAWSNCSITHLIERRGEWSADADSGGLDLPNADRVIVAAALARGDIAIRPVQRRQVFIGGVPVGDTFE